MTDAFLGIDTARHVASIRLVCPPQWQVALVSETSVIDSTDADSAERVAQDLAAQGIFADDSESNDAVVGAFWVHLFPIQDHLKTNLGYVLVYGPNGAVMEDPYAAVELLVRSLESEVQLSVELGEMAEELNRRHEELNLIYDTNDQPDVEADDDDVLTGIVENVVDYLEADLVLLSVPSRGVWVVNSAPGVDVGATRSAFESAEDGILEWLRVTRQPLVINSRDDSKNMRVDWVASVASKLLVVPITDDHEQVIGCLALCRGDTSPRIVNSDKNLLRALSRRIGKVIAVSFDPLTGLPRRTKFERLLDRSIAGLISNREQHCLLHINIDGMSAINEQFGIRTGDAAIELVAKLVQQAGRTADICGRVGGDEFALLLMNCKQDAALAKAGAFQQELAKQPFIAGRSRQTLRASIGLVTLERGTNATEAMTKASVACGIAKERGGAVTQVYEAAYEKVEQKREEVRLLTVVRRALESDRMFQLYAQPIVPLLEEQADPHFEILLRLFDNDGELVSPVDFIPVAEKHSLMPQIDRWVTKAALASLAQSRVLERYPDTVCSINLSGQSFGADSVLDEVQQMLRVSDLPARNICFEVTETTAIQDLGGAQYHINNIRRLGCQFALDDFGAGLSSFTYLRVLPLDYVKIDGSFVKDMLNDDVARTMVQSIHNVGNVMGLKTVAEYVENEDIAEALKGIGIDYGQGFGLGKPMPIQEYLARYASTSRRAHG